MWWPLRISILKRSCVLINKSAFLDVFAKKSKSWLIEVTCCIKSLPTRLDNRGSAETRWQQANEFGASLYKYCNNMTR